MRKWYGKYVIGLTGNIATGKSIVRRMLEHLGAFSIDADVIGHRAIQHGAPGFEPVVRTFGREILGDDGEIDRSRLAAIVFDSAEELKKLEDIVHPLVIQAIDFLVSNAAQKIIVIEAVKLLEAGIAEICDSVWVTYASEGIQLSRLTEKRGMKFFDARRRIAAQPPQIDKVEFADVLIKNEKSIEETWQQVLTAWNSTIPVDGGESLEEPGKSHAMTGKMTIVRALPRHSGEIAKFVNQLQPDSNMTTRADIMAAFGEKAFYLLKMDENFVGLLGWQVENLISRTTNIQIDPRVPISKALPALINEMEKEANNLQCEASLVVVVDQLKNHTTLWASLGYSLKEVENLDVLAWKEAAKEIIGDESAMFFKQLRQDRVLKPL